MFADADDLGIVVKTHTAKSKGFLLFTVRRNARIASAVLATAIPSVCLSHAGSVH